MGHYYNGAIIADPNTTREELVAAATELAGNPSDHRNDCVLKWIASTPDHIGNLPWCIAWWGSFRCVMAHEFCTILARNNMGRTRSLVYVSVDEEPDGDRPFVETRDFSTWVEQGVMHNEPDTPRCAWPPKPK